MTEEQAWRIIELLEDIKGELANLRDDGRARQRPQTGLEHLSDEEFDNLVVGDC